MFVIGKNGRVVDSLEYAGDFRIDVEPMDICVLGEHLYVLGYHEGHVIHRFTVRDNSAEQAGSFGEPFQEHPLRRRRLDHMDCLEPSSMLVVGVEESPVVRAFTSTGDSLWSVTMPDHEPLSITEQLDGSILYSMPEDQDLYHWTHAVVGLSNELVAVQLGLIWRGIKASEANEWDTRILSVGGMEHSRLHSEFRFLFVRGNLVYGTVSDPYPKVIVAEIGRERDQH